MKLGNMYWFVGHLLEVDGIDENTKQIARECMLDEDYTRSKQGSSIC